MNVCAGFIIIIIIIIIIITWAGGTLGVVSQVTSTLDWVLATPGPFTERSVGPPIPFQ